VSEDGRGVEGTLAKHSLPRGNNRQAFRGKKKRRSSTPTRGKRVAVLKNKTARKKEGKELSSPDGKK